VNKRGKHEGRILNIRYWRRLVRLCL